MFTRDDNDNDDDDAQRRCWRGAASVASCRRRAWPAAAPRDSQPPSVAWCSTTQRHTQHTIHVLAGDDVTTVEPSQQHKLIKSHNDVDEPELKSW